MLFVFPLRLSMPSFIQFGPVVSSERVLGSKIGNNIYKYEASCRWSKRASGLVISDFNRPSYAHRSNHQNSPKNTAPKKKNFELMHEMGKKLTILWCLKAGSPPQLKVTFGRRPFVGGPSKSKPRSWWLQEFESVVGFGNIDAPFKNRARDDFYQFLKNWFFHELR